MGGVQFETTINLGNIITIIVGVITWAVTLAIAWQRFTSHIDMLDFRVKLAEESLDRLAKVLEKLISNEGSIAVLQKQVSALEALVVTLNKTIEDLRRGIGWIQNPRRANLDGEYKRGG